MTLSEQAAALDTAETADDCRECKQPLTELDNGGQYLRGCLTCNIWWTDTQRSPGPAPTGASAYVAPRPQRA